MRIVRSESYTVRIYVCDTLLNREEASEALTSDCADVQADLWSYTVHI